MGRFLYKRRRGCRSACDGLDSLEPLARYLPVYRRRCLREATEDLEDIDEEIERLYDAIDHRVDELEGQSSTKRRNDNNHEIHQRCWFNRLVGGSIIVVLICLHTGFLEATCNIKPSSGTGRK